MNEDELKNNEEKIDSIYTWLVPIFTIPLILWLFITIKNIFSAVVMYNNYPDNFSIYFTIIHTFFGSNLLYFMGPLGPIPLIAWIFLGIKGFVVSKRYLKNSITKDKIAKRVYKISLTMIILSIFMLLSTIVLFTFTKYSDNQEEIDKERTHQEFIELFSSPQIIKDIRINNSNGSHRFVLNNDQLVLLDCDLRRVDNDKLIQDKELLINKEVKIELSEPYYLVYADEYINEAKLKTELGTLAPEVSIYLNGENLQTQYCKKQTNMEENNIIQDGFDKSNDDFRKLKNKLKTTSVYLLIFLVLGFISFVFFLAVMLNFVEGQLAAIAYMFFAIFIINYSIVLRSRFLKIEKYSQFEKLNFKKEKKILTFGYILSIPFFILLINLFVG